VSSFREIGPQLLLAALMHEVLRPKTPPLSMARRLFLMLSRYHKDFSKRHFGWAEFRQMQAATLSKKKTFE
jgi:hypothetical protein